MRLIHMFAPAYCVQLMGRFSNTIKPLLLFAPVSFVFFSIAVVTITFDTMSHIQPVLLLNSHLSYELKLIYVPSACIYLFSSISSFLVLLCIFKKTQNLCVLCRYRSGSLQQSTTRELTHQNYNLGYLSTIRLLNICLADYQ